LNRARTNPGDAGFAVMPMTETDARAIASWKYPPPYDLYNWEPWHRMVRSGYEIANPEIRRQQYRSILHPVYGLSGFAQFFPMAGVTRLGLGLRPDLCGRGLGVPFVRAIVAEARRIAPGDEIDLEVLVSNTRAIRVYEKAGFRITDRYDKPTRTGIDSFYCMVYEDSSPPSSEPAEA
jgi:RimJ/RimL family protein N-acetyltransferase